jgi:hypothetical protein
MYATIAVNIRKGRIVPAESAKIPENGHALLVILDQPVKERSWKQVRSRLGWLKLRTDPAAWQRRIREEWDHRT